MMPRDDVVLGSGHEAFRLVIERHIFCRHGKTLHDWLDQHGSYECGNRSITSRNFMCVVHRVTRKKLVASITAQSYSDVFAHKACEQIGRDEGAVRKRFIEPG